MGFLVIGTISVSVMTFYSKYLYHILKLSRRDARYGLMCPLTIQTHCNNEDMSLIRNRIGEGSSDCFLLPLCDKGWELMAPLPEVRAFEAYHVVKGMRSNTLSKPKWVYPKCCHQDVVDAECGLFVMRHMLEIIKLDVVNSFEKVLSMDEPYSNDDIDDVRTRWVESFLEVM
ncbi:hypothetical protein CASFOL_039915 [Castilleja foliolosa]|uniref:Ubiquitin-like protease family profile domain-containing protein n=1 Tax=Castilleja foliolosa TaxID=1961234 RepID=A0ABD3BIC3_9LAMI